MANPAHFVDWMQEFLHRGGSVRVIGSAETFEGEGHRDTGIALTRVTLPSGERILVPDSAVAYVRTSSSPVEIVLLGGVSNRKPQSKKSVNFG